MSMDLAPQGHTMAVTVERGAAAPLVFTDEQRQMIRDSFAGGASDEEFAVLMEIAKARRLNPLLKQVHFVARWDSQKGREVWSTQVSIDGLRAIAERTGIYAGQDEPEFIEAPDGTLKACKVKVYRKDWERPAVGVAYFAEYVQTRWDKKAGKQVTSSFWQRMPHTMLAKCAESLALRKAFPEDTSGLYTPEEMGQVDNDRPEVEPKTERQPTRQEPRQIATEVTVEAEALEGEVVDAEEDTRPVAVRDLIASIEHCTLPGEVADRWIAGAAERKVWEKNADGKSWTAAVWTAAVCRVAALQRVDEERAKVWLKKAVADRGPQGPNGGRKPTGTGNAASAHGEGTEGTAANDSSPVNAVRVVSDAAQAIIERHGANLWGFRGALKKHREELLPGDVPELAKVLARLDVDPLTGAGLALVAAERAVCTLTGLVYRRAA